MRLKRILEAMEGIAPHALALDYDNSGLLISPDAEEITAVLIALDCTDAVAEEAVRIGAQLVITHHPLFFHGIKHIRKDDPETMAAYTLIRNGVGLFSAHTNLDAAPGGVNDTLARTLGLTDLHPLGTDGIARTGMLQTPMLLADFAQRVGAALRTGVSYAGAPDKRVQRVALCGGDGGSEIENATASADVYVTGGLKYHGVLEACAGGLSVVLAGHHETEAIVLPVLIDRLQKAGIDVKYHLSCAGIRPLTHIESNEGGCK